MSDVLSGLTDPHRPPYYPLRPKPQRLALFLRAAAIDDHQDGPWLVLHCAVTETGTHLYRHHIHLVRPEVPYTVNYVTMLGGADALAFAVRGHWPIHALTDPTSEQLRALGTHAVMLHDVAGWNADFDAWAVRQTQCAPAEADRADRASSDARGLRWQLAEQWLRATE